MTDTTSETPDYLHIELTSSLDVDDLDDPVAQTVHHSFRAFYFTDDDAEVEVEVAHGSLKEIPVTYDTDYDPDDEELVRENFDIMDALSSETMDMHEAIMANLDKFPEGIRHPVYLHNLVVNPEYRSQGVGTRILRRLMLHWGNYAGTPSHLFLLAYPPEPNPEAVDRREQPLWRYHDPKGFQEAKKHLRHFYERLGFELLGKTDFMVFDLQCRIPNPSAAEGRRRQLNFR
jgi:GNAT superfamily N-acetyltransferase